jgi:DNA-binding XRE family transcriptional regulator
MLRREQVEVVRRLLAANVSQREISRRTGISRDTIRRIFKGKWQPPPNPPQISTAACAGNGPVGRCPDCGAMVVLPCLACAIRGGHGRALRSGRHCGTIARHAHSA